MGLRLFFVMRWPVRYFGVLRWDFRGVGREGNVLQLADYQRSVDSYAVDMVGFPGARD